MWASPCKIYHPETVCPSSITHGGSGLETSFGASIGSVIDFLVTLYLSLTLCFSACCDAGFSS